MRESGKIPGSFAISWEQRKLSEMCGTFEYGLNVAAKEFDGKNKYIRITDIDDASREFLLSDLSSPDICLDGMSKYLLSSGDIVFARTGASVGKTYIYRENDGIVYFAGFLIRAKVNQDNDAEFVFQSTLSPSYEKYIRITSQRSGQPGVNAQEYGEYDLFAPSKEEQQRIGQFLRGIDNLITLHQRKLRVLCILERLLYENIKQFEVTVSWEQRKVSEITSSYSGGTPKAGTTEYYDGDIPFIRSGEIYGDTTELFITEEGLNSSSAKMVHIGDILYALYGATSGEVSCAKLDGAINQAILAIIPNDEVNADFLVEWFRKEKAQITDKYLQGGQGNLSAQIIKDLKVTIPMREEQNKIGEYFSKVNHLITLHQRKP